ncbi:M16 family metallopeptidase [Micromonospora cathayae]|uniref:Insulinase family protein n=1 Tax=Micromonospora cathayae TaxID=3028804 RepID=A0ABY7ZUU6_9ACTN|nr:insulinase family protein [Micromonospora sp. HUAS 3]WDZ85694.1 insulinase family protein [Micromonospora sp. HUAS 3]
MERVLIDGVPVFWARGPEPLTAALLFGCGGRDETFRTIGITHLVEHLTMGSLPRVHHDRNASVDLDVTIFTATGRPDQVVTFLDGVCRTLADLPTDRIDKEAGVLTAEGGNYTDPTSAALYSQRLGVQGAGLAPWAGPGYDRLSAEQVRAHAARFFVAGNAALVLTGPPPADLRLPLPPGPRPEHLLPEPMPTAGPVWFEHVVAEVGVSLLGTGGPVWAQGMEVLSERLEQIARHTHGLSYEVGGDVVPLDRDRRIFTLTVDAREGQEAEVAGLLWTELRRMADEGPTGAELADRCEAARELADDPRAVEPELLDAAVRELFGMAYQDPATRLAQRSRVTPEEVRAAFREALSTAQLVVPCGVAPDLPGLAEGGCRRDRQEPTGRVFRPPLLAKVLTKDARGLRLILTDDGVALRDPDGDVHRIRFSEVVGVEEDGAGRTVFGLHGCQVPVDPELFKGAEAAVRAVDAAVPAALRYRRSELVNLD